MNVKFNALKLHENDNVAVVLKNIQAEELIHIDENKEEIKALNDIPYGHKIALNNIAQDETVLKYGECMGIATQAILKGDHVHISNVRGLNDKERLNIVNQLLES